MAVTIGVADLRAALRLTDSTEETAEVTRLLAYATEAVQEHVPIAPDTAHNEAVRRLVGYLYDMPEAGRGDAYANGLRNSGAARILLPYRMHRAGYADAKGMAQAAVGSVGNPVTGVDVSGTTLTVSFSDGTSEVYTLPSGGGGGGEDTVARDAAAAAQTTADGAQTEIDTHEASTHNTDATARTAAATAQGEIDTHEASTHNTDSTARAAAAAAQATADTNTTGVAGNVTAIKAVAADVAALDVAGDITTALNTHAALPNIHHTPPTNGGGGNGATGVLPLADNPTAGTATAGKVVTA